jgi:RNA polymerase sigma-70 factor, ECF subfamily
MQLNLAAGDPMTPQTPKTDYPEASLIAMAKTGNAAAINQLIDEYWHEAYHVAVRILRCHEDAEEIAQDSLWAATTHLATFREDASFRTWLHRIVVNHSLMKVRRKHSRVLDSSSPLPTGDLLSGIKGSPTPEELLLEAESRAVIQEGLSQIPSFYSVALQLAAREDRSVAEIADSMGISRSAAKTRLHRGRAHLRREVLRRWRVGRALRPELKIGLQPYRPETESLVAA